MGINNVLHGLSSACVPWIVRKRSSLQVSLALESVMRLHDGCTVDILLLVFFMVLAVLHCNACMDW